MNIKRFKGKLLDGNGDLISEIDGDLQIAKFDCVFQFQGKPFDHGWFFMRAEYGNRLHRGDRLVVNIADGPMFLIKVVDLEPSDDDADVIVGFKARRPWTQPYKSRACLVRQWPSSPHEYQVRPRASGVLP